MNGLLGEDRAGNGPPNTGISATCASTSRHRSLEYTRQNSCAHGMDKLRTTSYWVSLHPSPGVGPSDRITIKCIPHHHLHTYSGSPGSFELLPTLSCSIWHRLRCRFPQWPGRGQGLRRSSSETLSCTAVHMSTNMMVRDTSPQRAAFKCNPMDDRLLLQPEYDIDALARIEIIDYGFPAARTVLCGTRAIMIAVVAQFLVCLKTSKGV